MLDGVALRAAVGAALTAAPRLYPGRARHPAWSVVARFPELSPSWKSRCAPESRQAIEANRDEQGRAVRAASPSCAKEERLRRSEPSFGAKRSGWRRLDEPSYH